MRLPLQHPGSSPAIMAPQILGYLHVKADPPDKDRSQPDAAAPALLRPAKPLEAAI